MILDKIVESKKQYIHAQKQKQTLTEIRHKLEQMEGKGRSLFDALSQKQHMAIIAEIKKASPSKGILVEDFDPLRIANDYFAIHVDAISILTETDYFLGRPEYLEAVSKVSPIPLLRKDFVIDEYQLYESKLLGADAVLLIASILDEKTFQTFFDIATNLGLDCLCEAHNEEEIKKIEQVGGNIIGINNRDLKTFAQDIQTTIRLLPFISKGKIVVSESAIKTPDEINMLKQAGVSAVLIGETFMKSENMKETADFLRGV